MLQMSFRAPLLAMHGRRVAPRSPAAEGQALLGVHPIEALFADLPAFALQQHPEASVPEAHAGLGQLPHPLAQGREGIATCLVVRRGSCRLDHAARTPRAHLVVSRQVFRHFALPDGL